MSQLLPLSRKEGLLPLPEGARLSSNSPPLLPRIPHTPLDLPHLASMPITERTAGDLMWAATYEPPPLPPMTILGMPILQHPQPQSVQASSGITSLSPTVPTSLLPVMAHPSTKPLCHRQSTSNIKGQEQSGTYPSRTASAHPSLYESRNPSPAPQRSLPPTTGQTSRSSMHHFHPDITKDIGNESRDSSDQSHNLHESYSHPLSCDTNTPPMRQAVRVLSSYSPDPSRHSQTRLPSPMESQNPSRPPSRCSHALTPLPHPVMTLTEAIQYYQRTATDLSIAIPEELKRAEYCELYEYYAYELPFILAWGRTQAGNDYFMKKNRGLPADDILQYEAERNARLLYNEVHRNAPMEEFPPYEDIVTEAYIQMPMPDEPPVAPPRAPVPAFKYGRGQVPPGTYPSSYRPFAGVGSLSGGGGQPVPPSQPPVPPQLWALLHHPAPPKAPTPPAPWVLTDGQVAPYDEFKPKILKEVNDFHGDSNNISCFFQKCELHFELFNQHFQYPAHKVIFCISRLTGDAPRWWELQFSSRG